MLSDYIEENLPKVDYKLKIQLFNPLEPQQEYVDLIANYITPSRLFIGKSARNLNVNDVEFNNLTYIIEECHKCNEKQKYEASIVTLYKFHQIRNDVVLINRLKQEIVDSFDHSKVENISNFEWADQYSDGTQKIFYLLRIKIGRNKLVKIGITSDRLRRRLAGLKSDININYEKHTVHIEPLLIVDCVDNEEFEKEIKMLVLEYGCKSVNYQFGGSTETYSSKYKDAIMSIVIDAVGKSDDNILFDANAGSGSNQQEDQQVAASTTEGSTGLSHVSII